MGFEVSIDDINAVIEQIAQSTGSLAKSRHNKREPSELAMKKKQSQKVAAPASPENQRKLRNRDVEMS